MNIRFEKIHAEAVLPTYAHGPSQDAGMDLYTVEGVYIGPGCTEVVSLGLKMSMPAGVQAEIRSRSGLSTKGIVVANSPATIDPSYRGLICVILHNQGKETYYVAKGDRIAQMVIMPYIMADIIEGSVADIPSLRGECGLGSTGC